jgi:group I intron endonuclease
LFVYLIRNATNGKVYVGKTVRKNLQSYFKHNLRNALRGGKDKNYLYSSIRKYGPDTFQIEALCQPPTEALALELERWYIQHFDSFNPTKGYNLTRGGDGVSGMKQSEYCKQRVRETQLGRKQTDEQKLAASLRSKGNKHALGLTPWNKNKSWSDETRKKMSESAKRRWQNISSEELQKYKEVGKEKANLRWNTSGEL